MTEVQRITLRQSEARSLLIEILALEDADYTDEVKTEERSLQTELQTLEQRHRSALLVEPKGAASNGQHEEPDGESRELASLESRVSAGRYLHRIASERAVDGAEAELQDHLGLPGNAIPWAALAPAEADDLEVRAITPGPSNIPARSTYVERVFHPSEAAWLGVMMPSVPAGEQVYNLISAGPAVAPKAQDAAADATAGSISSTALKPTRITGRYTLRVEEMAEDGGLEPAIRADLRGLLSESLDAEVVSGGGTIGSFDEGITQLNNPTDDGTAIAYASAKALGLGNVDGTYARNLGDLRLLCGAKTYETLGGKTPTNDDSQDALMWWMQHTSGVRVSGRIAAPSSNVQRAVVAKMGSRVAAYAPIWEGVRIIRDQFTAADKGQVHLTAYMLAAFKVVDTSSFVLRDLKLA